MGLPAAGRAPVTNVRNLSSPFWRGALKRPNRRCLVPVTDFCEWSGEKGSKREHWFSVHQAPIFAFAGVWRPLDDRRRAYAFLTCAPNPLVATIHPKAMPVMLLRDDYEPWLDGEVESPCALAQPFPSQLMRVA
ncbi:MAG TPA: SOS response-associated peptidase family protein [Allosphingosinicella sp.]